MIGSLSRGFKSVATNGLVPRSSSSSSSSSMLLYSTFARKLEGKVAVITGGASGLGKATAGEFIRQGARVVIADIDDELGPKAAAELGSSAHFISCDVTVEDQVSHAVHYALSRHGKLDVFLNSAGSACAISPPSIADLDMEEFDRVMRLNVRGTVLGIKHAAKAMIPKGSGSILCISSISGLMGGLGPHSYTISKSTIPGIVRSAASELCKHGVRTNCISPAVVLTPLTVRALREAFEAAGVRACGEEQLGEMVKGTSELRGETCEERDVAKAALYLASDDSKFVTGHNLVVDGGLTCFKHLNLPSP